MMRTIAVVVVVLALMMLVSSCSVKTGTETTTSAPAPADTAAAPADTAAPAGESAAKVTEVIVGDKFDDADKKITNETSTFQTDTPEIFVNAGITGLKTGANITGTLAAVDVTLSDGTAIKDKDLKSTDVAAPAEEATARFSFTPPEKGWPVGSYAVKIAVDGQVIDTVDLTVEKASQ